MNTLYKYLNDILITHRETFESLFDSEYDLLDRELTTKGLNWLLDRKNAFIHDNAEQKLKVNDNGIIKIIYNGSFCVDLEETIDSGNKVINLHKAKVVGSLKYYINNWY